MCAALNEECYLKLCKVCDRLLLIPDATIEHVAIVWLHIIREHPVFLDSYVDLFKSISSINTIRRRWKRIARHKVGWCWQLVKSVYLGRLPWFSSKELPVQIDFLFVSHMIDVSQAGQAVDFYYGGVPNELVAQGHTAVITLINHTRHQSGNLVEKWRGCLVPRVLLSKSLGLLKEFEMHRRLAKESIRLKIFAKRQLPGLLQRVSQQASQEALSGGSQTTLRIGEQIHALVVKHKPRVVVVTHEGHAWERIIFAAARSAFPAVRCVGYQHAALFRMQHAIRRNLANKYNPDQILTAGIISKMQLEHAPNLEGIPVSVLGSNRSPKKVNVIGRTFNQENVNDGGVPACLVIPEGVASECHILFEFSLESARAAPDILFVWRLHPLVSLSTLTAQNPNLRNLPKNIRWSHVTLEEDIACSRWALYRGSTAVVQSVVAGLRPIYLQLQDELTIDPLYELQDWRISVASTSELQQIIFADIKISRFPPEEEIKHARGYCESLFTPFDVSALTALSHLA